MLQGMSPKRAMAFVYSFDLLPQEAFCIVACDIRRNSCVQVAQKLFVSEETVTRRRRAGYKKIWDGIKTT